MTSAPTTKRIVLDSTEFIRGMTSGRYTDDGFISSNASCGVNLSTVPGVIYPQQTATNISPGTSGPFIAGCRGGGIALGSQNNYFVTNSNKFYNYNGITISLGATGAGVKQYNSGKTDIIFYKENLYTTSDSDITLLTLGASYAITAINTETWWTVTKGKASLGAFYPHPMLVFEDTLWIADSSSLHKWDGTTATATALLLTDDQNITALGIDPGSGKMMIATTQGPNGSGTIPRTSKISFWDGVSNKVLRAVIVDDMVTAMYSVGGTLYVLYGRNLGYWNGAGITFLRKLDKISSYAGDNLGYKNHITSIGNTLYVIDGTLVLAYESIQGGSPKVFYYAWGQTTSLLSEVITLQVIIHGGQDDLLIAYRGTNGGGTDYVFKFPTRTVVDGAATQAVYNINTRLFKFANKIRIKSIKVSFVNAILNGISPIGIQTWRDQAYTVAFEPAAPLGEFSYELEYKPRSQTLLDLDDFYLTIFNGDTSNYSAGIRKIVIYYDNVD